MKWDKDKKELAFNGKKIDEFKSELAADRQKFIDARLPTASKMFEAKPGTTTASDPFNFGKAIQRVIKKAEAIAQDKELSKVANLNGLDTLKQIDFTKDNWWKLLERAEKAREYRQGYV